jgi:hypothetical protein
MERAVTGRALTAAAVVLLCGACGAGRPATSPSTPRSTEPVAARTLPVWPRDLCGSSGGLLFFDASLNGDPRRSSPRAAARPWRLDGERLEIVAGKHGARLVSLGRAGSLREVLTVRWRESTHGWYVAQTTGCLTGSAGQRPCGDVVAFHGTIYRRPPNAVRSRSDQIGVGRPFGQGRLPACADVTAYAGTGRHLVGAVAPITVYQQEEVPSSDSVVTSPASELGPRIYDAS